jgi:hypothetical protein
MVEIPKVANVQIIVSEQGYRHFETAREKLFLKEGGLLLESNGVYPTSYVATTRGTDVEKIEIRTEGEDCVHIVTVK